MQHQFMKSSYIGLNCATQCNLFVCDPLDNPRTLNYMAQNRLHNDADVFTMNLGFQNYFLLFLSHKFILDSFMLSFILQFFFSLFVLNIQYHLWLIGRGGSGDYTNSNDSSLSLNCGYLGQVHIFEPTKFTQPINSFDLDNGFLPTAAVYVKYSEGIQCHYYYFYYYYCDLLVLLLTSQPGFNWKTIESQEESDNSFVLVVNTLEIGT